MRKLWAYEYAGSAMTDILECDDSGIFTSQTRKNLTLPTEFIARHSGSFVLAAEGDVDVPAPRFNSLRELHKHLFKIESTGDGMYAIRNVPVYKSHPDTRKYGINCDRGFLDRMVKNFYATIAATKDLFGSDKYAWRPKLHYGHTPDSPDVEERENAAFLDNLYRVDDFLVSDIIGLDKATLNRVINGRYPDRSAEVDLKRARLLSVALLGFRTPHFALPQMQPQELRQQYLAVIQKNHKDVDGIVSQVFLEKDFDMPQAKKSNRKRESFDTSNPENVAKFFMELSENERMNAMFEQACSKHCDQFGAMPQGGNLMGIIQQIMQQMMSQKMNTAQPGPSGQGGSTQFNSSDALDMESRAHYEAGEEDLDEEGTEVAKGKQGEDANVKSDGQPDVDDPDYDTVSEGGSVVSKSVAQKLTRAKNTLKNVRDPHAREQLSAMLDEVGSAVEGLSSLVTRQHNSLGTLMNEFKIQKNARRRETFQRRFEKMAAAGNPNASTSELVMKHSKILMSLSDEAQAEEYLKTLEAAPSLPHGRPISERDVYQPEKSAGRMERAKNTIERDRGLRQSGVKAEHLAIIDEIDAMVGEESED